MEFEEIMQKLVSTVDNERRDAQRALRDDAKKNIAKIETNLPKLLEILVKSPDTLTSLNISGMLSDLESGNSSLRLGERFFDPIFQTLDKLTVLEMKDPSDHMGSVAMHLMNVIKPQMEQRMDLFQKSLPVLFKYMKKEHPIKWVAFGVINPIAMRNPKMLAGSTEQLFEIIEAGNTQLLTPLLNLYKFKPEAYEKRLDLLVKIFKTDPTMQGLVQNILLEISKKRPELFEPYIQELKTGLFSPTTATVLSMVYTEVARKNPKAIYAVLPEIKQGIEYVDALKYTAPNLLGLIGRESVERAREILPILDNLLSGADQNQAVTILMAFKNLGEMDRELLVPYIEKIRKFTADPQDYVRNTAQAIIDYMEKRDLHSLASQIDDQNKKIREACKSTEELKKYVDENVSMLKDFIADVVKKLPVPDKFETEGRIRKTLKLHFMCGCQSERCIYNKDRPFTIESKSWNKWMKVAFVAVKLGRAAMIPAIAAGDIVNSLKSVYDVYKEPEDQDYLTYISEPFLTSAEQDKLVEQLREARFFDMFHYNAQTAKWCCIMCKSN